MNVGDYAEEIIQLNPGINEDYAYDLAYEEFINYSKLKKDGYGDTHAKQLTEAIRIGII